MRHAQEKARILYKKFLTFYPRGFREQLGESMEQTFNDLCNERKLHTQRGLFGFVLWMFVETGVGIIKEHILLIVQGDSMKTFISNPRSAAITSFILSLPIGLLRLILGSDIEPLVAPIESVLTIDGSQPNGLGFTIICGGLLLLPVAFLINLRPLLKRDGPEGKRKHYALNLIVGAIILLLIIFTWGGLIVEEIYCLRGIRCD